MQRLLQMLLLLIAAFFIFVPSANAAQILSKSGSAFGNPTVQGGNNVYISLTPNKVKFVRHTKYLDSSQTKQSDYSQIRGNRAGFSYRCPGYYMTRIYSDLSGTQLIGTIRVYVPASDLPNATTCASVTPPPANTPPAPPPPTVVKKINVTHPNPVVVEPRNMVDEVNLEQLLKEQEASWLKFNQKGDPGTAEYVDPYPPVEPPDEPPVLNYPFENPYFDPVYDMAAFYSSPNPNWGSLSSWNLNNLNSLPYLYSQGYSDHLHFKNKSEVMINADLEGDACVAADGNIYYYESYHDDVKDANEDNTTCISRAEYHKCDLVRYMARNRDGWNEEADRSLQNVASDLKSLLSFSTAYCNTMTNYLEDEYPYDPFTQDNVQRATYQIVECVDDSASCDEMIADPYFTPTTAPVEPGETDPGISPPDGGSPRRG